MKPLSTLYLGNDLGRVTVDGGVLSPRYDLRCHSPDGFSWGFGGSGPSQLSLAILADFLREDARALELYQPFKWRIVAQLPRSKAWRLTGTEVRDVVLVLEDEMKRGPR